MSGGVTTIASSSFASKNLPDSLDLSTHHFLIGASTAKPDTGTLLVIRYTYTHMHNIAIRKVKDLEVSARQWVQRLLGRTLKEDEEVAVSVLDRHDLKAQEAVANKVWDNPDDAIYDRL